MPEIDLKAIERRAFRSTFQDGLWDIYLGLLLLLFGIPLTLLEFGMSIEWIAVIAITLCILSMGIFFGGKKFITVPRIGRVKFGESRKAKNKKMTLLLVLSFLVGVALLVVGIFGDKIQFGWSIPIPFPMLIYGAICLATFSSGAYLLDNIRFYLYGIFYALPFPVVIILKSYIDIPGLWLMAYGLPSGVMLLIGAYLFFGFLRDYPPTGQEV